MDSNEPIAYNLGVCPRNRQHVMLLKNERGNWAIKIGNRWLASTWVGGREGYLLYLTIDHSPIGATVGEARAFYQEYLDSPQNSRTCWKDGF